MLFESTMRHIVISFIHLHAYKKGLFCSYLLSGVSIQSACYDLVITVSSGLILWKRLLRLPGENVKSVFLNLSSSAGKSKCNKSLAYWVSFSVLAQREFFLQYIL